MKPIIINRPKLPRKGTPARYELYLDYVNNFMTVGAFADFYHMSDTQAWHIIEEGRVTDNQLYLLRKLNQQEG